MNRYKVRFAVNGVHKMMIVEAAGLHSAAMAVIESMQGFYGTRPKILGVSGGRPVHTTWRMARR